tara:strand:+ start:186 stop:788 length:603 start_codon:yes stop_codon:yes gene_type:complete
MSIVGCSKYILTPEDYARIQEKGEEYVKNQHDNQFGKNIYKIYIDSNSSNKVLIRTSEPVEVRRIYPSGSRKNWKIYKSTAYKYYYSFNKESFEEAVLEASGYCHIDNPTFDISKFCVVSMVNDFNANEVEIEYGRYLMEVRDDYFELTIKNYDINSRECAKRNFGTSELPIFIFDWIDCETNIRLKRELPKKMFEERKI